MPLGGRLWEHLGYRWERVGGVVLARESTLDTLRRTLCDALAVEIAEPRDGLAKNVAAVEGKR